MDDITTYTWDRNVAGWSGPQVVISRTGTATVAWTGVHHVVRTLDEPPGPGDPQNPAAERLGDAPLDDVTLPDGHHFLDVDAAGAQTLAWMPAFEGDGPLPFQTLVLSSRAPGDRWSNPTPIASAYMFGIEPRLAVNASGAAVVFWSEERPNRTVLFASYRSRAGADWTAPERLPAPNTYDVAVDIDDAGRVLLVYSRDEGSREGVWAVRRAPSGGWGQSRRLSGPGHELFSLGLGANGAAVVTYGHYGGAGYGRPDRAPFARRMSPNGRWHAPVRQPAQLGTLPTNVDGKGRALLTGWQGTDLVGRWSRSDGRWCKPFILAPDVRKTVRWLDVVVNGRGDAVAVWSVASPTRAIWARYQPAGQNWTKPVVVTAENPPRKFDVALGDRGHVAIAWSTIGNHKLIQVRRAFPSP
jgi:hypothetical protein